MCAWCLSKSQSVTGWKWNIYRDCTPQQWVDEICSSLLSNWSYISMFAVHAPYAHMPTNYIYNKLWQKANNITHGIWSIHAQRLTTQLCKMYACSPMLGICIWQPAMRDLISCIDTNAVWPFISVTLTFSLNIRRLASVFIRHQSKI